MITISQKFSKSKLLRDETPGPGSYLRFSEFGILSPKNHKIYNLKKSTTTIKDFFKKKILKKVLSDNNVLPDKMESNKIN